MDKGKNKRTSSGDDDEDIFPSSVPLNSSSFKFGSFIVAASGDKYSKATLKRSREHSLIMISDSETETVSDSEIETGDWPWRLSADGQVENIGASKDYLLRMDVDGSKDLVLRLKRFGVPPRYQSDYNFKEVVGSCNDLVCLYDRIANLICIWNPFTNEENILPQHKRHFGEVSGRSFRDVAVGFGFDVQRMDYRVVILNGFRPMVDKPEALCYCQIYVYKFRKNQWSHLSSDDVNTRKGEEKMVPLPANPFPYPTEGIYVNGSFYFMAKYLSSKEPWEPGFKKEDKDRLILCFNFSTDTFTSIHIPKHDRETQLYLSCWGDKVALFTKCPSSELEAPTSEYKVPTPKYEVYEIWVLEVPDVWTKEKSFRIRVSPGECNTPIGISNDSDFALLKTGDDTTGFCDKMKLYHIATEEVKSFLCCSAVMHKANAYKPSKVSVISAGKPQQQKKPKPQQPPQPIEN